MNAEYGSFLTIHCSNTANKKYSIYPVSDPEYANCFFNQSESDRSPIARVLKPVTKIKKLLIWQTSDGLCEFLEIGTRPKSHVRRAKIINGVLYWAVSIQASIKEKINIRNPLTTYLIKSTFLSESFQDFDRILMSDNDI